MILGVALTVAALIALHVLDTADGVRHRRFLPGRWWSMSWLDGLVAAALVWWHFVGANTSDDGYILTMARVSEHAGYMANYYRWFGTPEAPFGWYYDLLALWANVSTTSVWMRLPTLLMALACWWVISREVIPRLGDAVKHSSAAAWTAAGMFLAFWLPLNNGLRPEPIIALGILLTWCSVERAVATSRLLPVAIACIIGALDPVLRSDGHRVHRRAAGRDRPAAHHPAPTLAEVRAAAAAGAHCWPRSRSPPS